MSGLLEGLEASVLTLSMAKTGNPTRRIDSGYFSRAALAADAMVAMRHPQPIGALAPGVRSFGAYALTNEFEYQDAGVPFLRGTNYTGDFMDFANVLHISLQAHQLLHKSEVLPGMVLLSMSGSVGSVAVALESWDYPINSNQDIAKITPSGVSPFYLAAFLSSGFGKTQIKRLPVGSVQQHIFLWMIERIQVPRFRSSFEAAVARIVQTAYEAYEMVGRYFTEADDTLLASLGLAEWRPPEPLTYTARAGAAVAAGRLDAQYFMPTKDEVRRALAAMPGRNLGARVDSIREMFLPDRVPATMKVRNYDVTDALAPLLDAEKAPCVAAQVGSAKKVLKDGDVAISRLRAYLKEVAVVSTCDGIPSVGSSEFIVLRTKQERGDISPETLMVFLRSVPVQIILQWCQDGSQHPRFNEGDLLSIAVPDVVARVSERITSTIKKGCAARHQAAQLLECAKRAVEVAVEGGEAAATAYLDEADGGR